MTAPFEFDGWIVYVPQGSFTLVYGVFQSYDDAIAWQKRNGYDPIAASIHPIRHVEAKEQRKLT